MADSQTPYFIPIRENRRPADINSISSADSTYGSQPSDGCVPPATHDIRRANYHVKHVGSFAQALQDSATRAFPNRGRSAQRYTRVRALLLHWKIDDLFVLPELEDLQRSFQDYYSFETDVFAIPSVNPHLELMLKMGDMIKQYESEDTLFIVYYGGHARIDEARQSTWCATRQPGSPSLQWSAIQTLLERSVSDTLILLDCCAGAASATYASGPSTTETISASSWDAIAPDPGQYSFTNTLIEVLSDWRHRVFSAAMLHTEILARLKHPRPILINGRRFEARSTPVHFMMTSDHKAPSIEFTRVMPEPMMLPSPHTHQHVAPQLELPGFPSEYPDSVGTEMMQLKDPDENNPHVMISLALEDDQHLDLNDWEQWLASFPALAKYVKVQGVFKSHSTLLLLSLPVMVWDLLPDDPACSFIAFIRSNNLIASREPQQEKSQVGAAKPAADVVDSRSLSNTPEALRPVSDIDDDGVSVLSVPTYHEVDISQQPTATTRPATRPATSPPSHPVPGYGANAPSPRLPHVGPSASPRTLQHTPTSPPSLNNPPSFHMDPFGSIQDVPEGPRLARHVVQRLEDYFQEIPRPDASVTAFFASSLGIETRDVNAWFHSRRQQQKMESNFQNLKIHDLPAEAKDGAKMILPGDLQQLLDIFPTKQVLIIDLRSPTFFERSHIHEAINLRAPLSFIQNTTLEMIQDTITDEQSRRAFARWRRSRCVVFYDKVVEFAWECPVADTLYDKFRTRGGSGGGTGGSGSGSGSWEGQCFILKGHFHEFSSSFDKYISGTKMTRHAKDYLDGLRQQQMTTTAEDSQRSEERYGEWLRQRDDGDRAPPTELIPSKKAERIRTVEVHQRELEAELERRFPALYNKAKTLTPASSSLSSSSSSSTARGHSAAPSYDPAWSASHPGGPSDKAKEKGGGAEDDAFTAQAVEPLVRGVAKMQEAAAAAAQAAASMGGSAPSPPSTPLPKYNKTAATTGEGGARAKEKGGRLSTEEYDDFENDESLRNDPGFQKAGSGGGGTAGTGASGGGGGTPSGEYGTKTKGSGQQSGTHFFSRFRIKPSSK